MVTTPPSVDVLQKMAPVDEGYCGILVILPNFDNDMWKLSENFWFFLTCEKYLPKDDYDNAEEYDNT